MADRRRYYAAFFEDADGNKLDNLLPGMSGWPES